MSADVAALLRTVLAEPEIMNALTPEQLQRLIVAIDGVVDELSPVPTTAVITPAPAWSESDLLTVAEAAAALRVTARWLYRHAKTLPFARKLSRKVLRFSRVGLVRWLATRRT